MQGKVVLRLGIESLVFVEIFALLIVLMPKVKAMGLVHFVRRLAQEVTKVINRPLHTPQNLFNGEPETGLGVTPTAALFRLRRGGFTT